MMPIADTLLQDLRLAVRKLASKPAFTLVAVLSLALGIGANTAIFSVVNTVLLQPLPYPEPDEVVRIWETFLHPGGRGRGSVSVPNLRDWQEQNQVFEAVGGYSMNNYNLMGESSPTWARGAGVTPEVFPLLGVGALMGRTLGLEDAMHDRVVVLSHALWQSFFGADAGLVGETIRLDGENYSVVGVMPPSFEFPPRSTAQLWTPLVWSEANAASRGNHWMATLARLKAGTDLEAARSDMEAVARRLEEQYPAQESRSVAIHRLSDSVVARRRPALLALWGAVGFVLLIACGNVANLLLARAASQHREFAVRAALGAGRARLAQQVVLESLLLALAGGTLGLAAGWRAVRSLASMPGTSLPAGQEVAFDVRILAFCIVASFLAALLAGLVPALRASRTNLQDAMKERTSSDGGSHRDPIRAALVVAEIALALVVLIGASLLVRSFLALQDVDPGVRTESVLTMRVPLPDKYDSTESIQGFYSRLLDGVEAIPGVTSTGTVNLLPIQDWGWNGNFSVEGQEALPASQQPFAEYRYVGGDYFESMGIALLSGRVFDERDHADAAPVVMINQKAAERYWPGESPVGKRVSFDSQSWIAIAGVVANVQNRGLRREVSPAIYLPHAQSQLQQMSLVVRTGVEPTTVAEAVRAEVQRIDPEQPVYLVKTMEQVVSTYVSSSRFNGILFSLFGGLALLLAMLGVYGVMSYNVTRRTGEIGLRMALGANRGDVVRMVVRQGLVLAVAGAVAGVVAAGALTRFLKSQLFAVEALDLVSFGVVTALLLVVALLACLVPARRAAAVEPMTALHYE